MHFGLRAAVASREIGIVDRAGTADGYTSPEGQRLRDDEGVPNHLTLFADYFQIHLQDEQCESDLGEAWTEQAHLDGLAVAEGILGIGTAVNWDVGVGVVVLPGEPLDDSPDCDHVVEASVQVPSGRLVVMGCTDYLPDARRFEIQAGWNRIKVSRSNLAAAIRASGEEPVEIIRLQVWPAPQSEPRIIKRWTQGQLL